MAEPARRPINLPPLEISEEEMSEISSDIESSVDLSPLPGAWYYGGSDSRVPTPPPPSSRSGSPASFADRAVSGRGRERSL